jgi:hypothetical protein
MVGLLIQNSFKLCSICNGFSVLDLHYFLKLVERFLVDHKIAYIYIAVKAYLLRISILREDLRNLKFKVFKCEVLYFEIPLMWPEFWI